MRSITLQPVPLTANDFRAYGDVLVCGEESKLINRGTTLQFPDLAQVDIAARDGRPRVSIYRATPYELPLTIEMLERHPLSSQLFMPLNEAPFLIVVAVARDTVEPSAVQAFISNGRQGVNYHRGTWHHPVIAVHRETDFLVLDRAGSGKNCDEYYFDLETKIVLHFTPQEA